MDGAPGTRERQGGCEAERRYRSSDNPNGPGYCPGQAGLRFSAKAAMPSRRSADSAAVRAAKRAIRHGWGVSLEAGLDIEDAAWRTAALSADRREGIAAFAEKRKPAWPGQ